MANPNRASQAKIVKITGAVKRARDDVLDLERLWAEILLKATVLAEVPCTSRYVSAEPCR